MTSTEEYKAYTRLFSRCEFPKQIYNRNTGEYMLTSCGSCNGCLLTKAQSRSLLCDFEKEDSAITYFVTLTFSNYYIPFCVLFIKRNPSDASKCDYVLYRYEKEVNSLIFVNDGEFPNWSEESFNHLKAISLPFNQYQSNRFLKRYSRLGSQMHDIITEHGYDEFLFLPHAAFSHVQNFVKRLRNRYYDRYSKKYLQDFRYYAVSEYGPKTLRAHYHLLVHFSNESSKETFIQYCNESWKFGRVTCEAVRSSATSYVAGYVNSFSCLPQFYKKTILSPKVSHSRFYGKNYYKPYKEEIYKNPFTFFDENVFRLNGKNVSFRPSTTFNDIFFPKINGFAQYDKSTLFQLYILWSRHIEYQITDQYFISKNHTSPILLAKEILQFIHTDNESRNYLLRNLSPEIKAALLPLDTAKYIHKHCIGSILTTQDVDSHFFKVYDRALNRIYNIILCSKHFFEFCCDKKAEIQYYRYNQIIDYYENLSSKKLKLYYELYEQLSSQDENYKEVFQPNYGLSDTFDQDRYEILKKTAMHQYLIRKNSDDMNYAVKHKELNDLNSNLLLL